MRKRNPKPFKDPAVITEAIQRITQRGVCPATAIKLALRMQRDPESLETWIDAVAVYASWERGLLLPLPDPRAVAQ